VLEFMMAIGTPRCARGFGNPTANCELRSPAGRRISFFFCQTHSIPRRRQLHMESRPLILATAYADAAVMIADNGLRYRQSEPRSMLLTGVIRREDALALFRSEPFAGICEFKDGKLVIFGRAEGELTAIRHGINGVQN